jgi:hypothetical protein
LKQLLETKADESEPGSTTLSLEPQPLPKEPSLSPMERFIVGWEGVQKTLKAAEASGLTNSSQELEAFVEILQMLGEKLDQIDSKLSYWNGEAESFFCRFNAASQNEACETGWTVGEIVGFFVLGLFWHRATLNRLQQLPQWKPAYTWAVSAGQTTFPSVQER